MVPLGAPFMSDGWNLVQVEGMVECQGSYIELSAPFGNIPDFRKRFSCQFLDELKYKI